MWLYDFRMCIILLCYTRVYAAVRSYANNCSCCDVDINRTCVRHGHTWRSRRAFMKKEKKKTRVYLCVVRKTSDPRVTLNLKTPDFFFFFVSRR